MGIWGSPTKIWGLHWKYGGLCGSSSHNHVSPKKVSPKTFHPIMFHQYNFGFKIMFSAHEGVYWFVGGVKLFGLAREKILVKADLAAE